MSVALLIFMAVAFMVLAGLLTAAESAYGYLPRHEAEALLQGKAGKPLRRILQHPVAHMHALRFWRVWFEMATAVTVATLFQMLLDNIWLAGLLATVVMAGIGFVLVGVSPRQIGRKHVTAVVVLTAGMVRVLRVVLGPVPGWLVRLGTAVAPGTQGPDAAFFTEEEFRELLDRASEADMIENTEAELIHSVFELGDTKVRSVMVPRTDMVCIDSGSNLRQAMSLFLRSGYSRVPVIEDSADQIVGILYLKDVAAQMHSDPAAAADNRVEDFARGVRYVPESKAVSELLQELQRESTHVAVVIDEYGGTAGLVTLEDLIEEIVGEIVDEYDSERPEIENLGGGRYRISSRAGIDDLGELFDVDLEDDEVDTVGGLLAKALGRVPIVGSEVVVDGVVLHAERLEGRRNRVSHIIAWKQHPDAEKDAQHDDGRESSRVHSTELVPRND